MLLFNFGNYLTNRLSCVNIGLSHFMAHFQISAHYVPISSAASWHDRTLCHSGTARFEAHLLMGPDVSKYGPSLRPCHLYVQKEDDQAVMLAVY